MSSARATLAATKREVIGKKVAHLRRDVRIHPIIGKDDRHAAGGARIEDVDVLGHQLGAHLEIGELLRPELVVETVEDEDRDEKEGQADDARESQRQTGLKRLRPVSSERRGNEPRPMHPKPAAAWVAPIGRIGLDAVRIRNRGRDRRAVRGRARPSARRRRTRRPGRS